jgi:hypothetical protein
MNILKPRYRVADKMEVRLVPGKVIKKARAALRSS